MAWNRKLGRIVYAVYPFVLVGVLIFAGAFFLNFTTEHIGVPLWYENVVTLHPNQTYIHNVTISYEEHEPMRGYGARLENGSIVVEEHPLTNTITSWTRIWLPLMISANETFDLNRSLTGPNGIIESWGHGSIAEGTGIGLGNPEVTQGGTYRLSLQNIGSEDVHPTLSWKIDWHHYEKPYLYYGITASAIALVYPAMFLIKKLGPWKSRQQTDEEGGHGISMPNLHPSILKRSTRKPSYLHSFQARFNAITTFLLGSTLMVRNHTELAQKT